MGLFVILMNLYKKWFSASMAAVEKEEYDIKYEGTNEIEDTDDFVEEI